MSDDKRRTESSQVEQSEIKKTEPEVQELTDDKETPKAELEIQELTDNDVEKLTGGATSMKKASVPNSSAVKLSVTANPMCATT